MTWERYGYEQLNKGRAEGLTKGCSKERTSIVENLLKNEFTSDQIAAMTGVPLEAVLTIQKRMLVAV